MKLWVEKEALNWAQEMQNEMRTRSIIFTTFRTMNDDSEIEVEVRIV